MLCALLPLGNIAQLERKHVRTAARLVGSFSKFNHVEHYISDVLHYLPISQHNEFKIAVWVWRCRNINE